jgi:hypothetical protein
MDVHLRSRLALDGIFFLFFIIYLSMVTFALYFIPLFTPLWFVFSEGEDVRVHILLSTFVYSYLLSYFTPFTAIISECTLLFKQ